MKAPKDHGEVYSPPNRTSIRSNTFTPLQQPFKRMTIKLTTNVPMPRELGSRGKHKSHMAKFPISNPPRKQALNHLQIQPSVTFSFFSTCSKRKLHISFSILSQTSERVQGFCQQNSSRRADLKQNSSRRAYLKHYNDKEKKGDTGSPFLRTLEAKTSPQDSR